MLLDEYFLFADHTCIQAHISFQFSDDVCNYSQEDTYMILT